MSQHMVANLIHTHAQTHLNAGKHRIDTIHGSEMLTEYIVLKLCRLVESHFLTRHAEYVNVYMYIYICMYILCLTCNHASSFVE